MLEFQQFNTMWDRKMKEYDERAVELLEAMRQRHELDMAEFQKKKTAEPQYKPKQSTELLDLRRIELVLAKQGEYAEAQKVKVRADALEQSDAEKSQKEREQQMLAAQGKFSARQEAELSALRQRIHTGAEEQRHARQQDLERLLQRYHNIKAELESQQLAERARSKKGFYGGLTEGGAAKDGGSPRKSASNSRLSSGSRPGTANSRRSLGGEREQPRWQ